MQPDQVRSADSRAWLARAEDDLGAATDLLALPTPRLRAALFHCQQAAEKALKGFLTWHDQPFAKTHDLRRVGRRCAEIAPALDPLLRRAAALTDYAWKFRYPGTPYEPSREEAATALELALTG
jgi:HEPN domain-containing protein